METLRLFLNSLAKCDQIDFAHRCGTSLSYLRKAISLGQRISETLALRIELVSGASVTVEDLRPDVPWHVIRGRPTRTCSTDPVQRASTEVA